MKILACVLLLAGNMWAQAAKPAPAPITYNEAVANEKKLFAADQKHDMEALKALFADDFVDIGTDGSSAGKAAVLKEIPTLKLVKYAQKNYKVTAMGPYAYAISYDSDATMIGADGKESRAQHGLNTVWIKRAGRWQILMHCRGEAKTESGK